MSAAIVRTERHRAGQVELVGALGGAILLMALLAPIEWFEELSTGGFTGRGTGGPPRGLTAWEEFGPWLIPIVLAAATPLVELALKRTGRSIPSAIRILVVAAGLAVLIVGVCWSSPTRCRRVATIYTLPRAEAGLIPAALGGGLLALGALASWLRERPNSPTHTGHTERIGDR